MTTSTPVEISTVARSDRDRTIATVVTAFSADPIARWFLPDPQRYLTYFPKVVMGMGGGAFEHNSAYVAGDFFGAALWLRPDVHSDGEALAALMPEAIPEHNLDKADAFMEQVQQHHPTERHWYLPFIGVDPTQQGRGLGSALLAHTLAECDRDHLPAYLEATSEGSRELYARHGFEVVATVQAGDSPPMWPMLRPAR